MMACCIAKSKNFLSYLPSFSHVGKNLNQLGDFHTYVFKATLLVNLLAFHDCTSSMVLLFIIVIIIFSLNKPNSKCTHIIYSPKIKHKNHYNHNKVPNYKQNCSSCQRIIHIWHYFLYYLGENWPMTFFFFFLNPAFCLISQTN